MGQTQSDRRGMTVVGSVGEGLRQRKARQTWEAIHQTARRLALERPVDEVSVQEIADGANVSVRTVFNYFPSKEDAVLGFREAYLPDDAVERFLASTGPLVDDVAELVFVTLRETHGDFTQAALLSELLRKNPGLIVRLIATVEHLEDKVFEVALRRCADPLRARIAAAVGNRLCKFAVDQWIREGSARDQRQTLREALAALHQVV